MAGNVRSQSPARSLVANDYESELPVASNAAPPAVTTRGRSPASERDPKMAAPPAPPRGTSPKPPKPSTPGQGGKKLVSNDYENDLEAGGGKHAQAPAPPFGTSANMNLYHLAVKNLTYKVRAKEDKVVLNDINAEARPGEILAVVGPSGAGKSTFMDAIGGRIDPKSLEGSILLNGQPVDHSFRKQSAYVLQDDALLPMLTVRETLLFSARLRLPSSVPYEEKLQRVNNLLKELGLENCADTFIGNEQVRGISGGEKRRVSIGVELIHNPSVLLLDEPTSGLDSTAALSVVTILRNMAEGRLRTIILSIHQPSFRILECLHRFLILARGNVIYHGSTRSLGHFMATYGKPVTEQANVLEFALDVVEEVQDTKELDKLVNLNKQQASQVNPRTKALEGAAALEGYSFATSAVAETGTLMVRNLINTLRTPELFFARVVIMVTTGLTMGSLFWKSGEDATGISNRASFWAFTLAIHLFTSTEALPIFLGERSVFVRETSRGAYRSSSYVLANAVVTIPFLFILAIVYSVTSYFMVGLAGDAGSFFKFAFILFMTLAVANSFVIGLSSFVPNFILGNTIITAVTAYYFLFSGFYIPKARIPDGWIWLNYLSTFKWPYEAFTWTEYTSDHAKDACYGPLVNGTCTFTAQDVLVTQAIEDDHTWTNVGVLALMFVLYRVIFYIGLRLQSRQTRK